MLHFIKKIHKTVTKPKVYFTTAAYLAFCIAIEQLRKSNSIQDGDTDLFMQMYHASKYLALYSTAYGSVADIISSGANTVTNYKTNLSTRENYMSARSAQIEHFSKKYHLTHDLIESFTSVHGVCVHAATVQRLFDRSNLLQKRGFLLLIESLEKLLIQYYKSTNQGDMVDFAEKNYLAIDHIKKTQTHLLKTIDRGYTDGAALGFFRDNLGYAPEIALNIASFWSRKDAAAIAQINKSTSKAARIEQDYVQDKYTKLKTK